MTTGGLPGELGAVFVSVVPTMAGASAGMAKAAAEHANTYSKGFGYATTAAMPQHAESAGHAYGTTFASVATAVIGHSLPGPLATVFHSVIESLKGHAQTGGQESGQVFAKGFTSEVQTAMNVLGGTGGNLTAELERSLATAGLSGGQTFSREFTNQVATGITALGGLTEENITRSMENAGLKGGEQLAHSIAEGLTTAGSLSLSQALTNVMNTGSAHGGRVFASNLAGDLRASLAATDGVIEDWGERSRIAMANAGQVMSDEFTRPFTTGAKSLWKGGIPGLDVLQGGLRGAGVQLNEDTAKLLEGMHRQFEGFAKRVIPTVDTLTKELKAKFEELGFTNVSDTKTGNIAKKMVDELQQAAQTVGPEAEKLGTVIGNSVKNAPSLKAGAAEIAAGYIKDIERAVAPHAENINKATRGALFDKSSGVSDAWAKTIMGKGREGIESEIAGFAGSGEKIQQSLLSGISKNIGNNIKPIMSEVMGAFKNIGGGDVGMGMMAASAMAGGVAWAAHATIHQIKETINLAKEEVAKFAEVGKQAGEYLVTSFKTIVAGKIPDMMGAFNLLESATRTTLEAPFNMVIVGLEATVGKIPIVGDALKGAVGMMRDSFGPLFAVFDQFKVLGGEVVDTMLEIADKYFEMTRRIAGTTLGTENIEAYAGVVREIMASGAIVHFEDVSDAVGRLSTNIKNLDLEQLKELTTNFAQAEELLGHIDETKFAGVVNAWDLEAGEANETLTMLVNTARYTGIEFNMLTDEMTRIGPAMRELGYDAESSAAFFAKMTQEGEKGTRLIFGMNEVVNKMNSLVMKGVFKSVQEGWDALIGSVKALAAAGKDDAALNLLKQYTTPSTAPLVLEDIKKGILDVAGAMEKIPNVHDEFGKAVEETKSVGEAFEALGHQVEGALAPISMGLGKALMGQGEKIGEWLKENQGKLANWGTEVLKSFLHTMGDAAKLFAATLDFFGPFLEALKDNIVLLARGIYFSIRPLLLAGSLLPGEMSRPFEQAIAAGDKVASGLAKAFNFDITNPLSKFDKWIDDTVDHGLPKLIRGLDSVNSKFQAVEAISEAFEEKVDGKDVEGFQAIHDTQGGVGTPDQPSLRLLGDQEQVKELIARLKELGIELRANSAGIVEGVRFPGTDKLSGEDAKKNWEQWFIEHITLPNKKPVETKLQPQNAKGKNMETWADIAEPGEANVTVRPAAPIAPPPGTGITIQGQQTGGPTVQGDWWPGRDSVPAMLEVGEYVVNREQAGKHRGLLDSINYGVRGYQTGGSVVELLYGLAKGAGKEIGLDMPWLGKVSNTSGAGAGIGSYFTPRTPSAAAPAAYTGGGDARAAVHAAMLAAGFPESDWPAIDYIVGKESSWTPTIPNNVDINAQRGDNSVGLGQLTLSNYRTYGPFPQVTSVAAAQALSPYEQGVAMMNYIKGRYHTVAAALAHWNANHNYQTGGAVEPVFGVDTEHGSPPAPAGDPRDHMPAVGRAPGYGQPGDDRTGGPHFPMPMIPGSHHAYQGPRNVQTGGAIGFDHGGPVPVFNDKMHGKFIYRGYIVDKPADPSIMPYLTGLLDPPAEWLRGPGGGFPELPIGIGGPEVPGARHARTGGWMNADPTGDGKGVYDEPMNGPGFWDMWFPPLQGPWNKVKDFFGHQAGGSIFGFAEGGTAEQPGVSPQDLDALGGVDPTWQQKTGSPFIPPDWIEKPSPAGPVPIPGPYQRPNIPNPYPGAGAWIWPDWIGHEMDSYVGTVHEFGHQAGGPSVQGDWLPGRDSIPAMLEVGEYVVNRDQAGRHRGLLDAINYGGLAGSGSARSGGHRMAHGVRGFNTGGGSDDDETLPYMLATEARGGRYPTDSPQVGGIPTLPSGGGQNIVGWLDHLVAWYNQQRGTHLGLTATFPHGPHKGHPNDQQQHSAGHAVDISGTGPEMAEFAKWWDANYRGITRQLIHNNPAFPSGQNIIGGHPTEGSQTYSSEWGGHQNHIHLAVQYIPTDTPPGVADPGATGPLPGTAPGPNGVAGMPPGYGTGPTPPGGWPIQMPNVQIPTGAQGPQGPYSPWGQIPPGTAPGAMPDWTASTIDWQRRMGKLGEDIIGTQTELQSKLAEQATLQGEYNEHLKRFQDEVQRGKGEELLDEENNKKLKEEKSQLDALNKQIATLKGTEQDKQSELDAAQLKGPPLPAMDQKYMTMSEQMGSGAVKGILQELGFPDVFGKFITSWGMWKLGMAGLGMGLNMWQSLGAGQGSPHLGVQVPPGPVQPGALPGTAPAADAAGDGGKPDDKNKKAPARISRDIWNRNFGDAAHPPPLLDHGKHWAPEDPNNPNSDMIQVADAPPAPPPPSRGPQAPQLPGIPGNVPGIQTMPGVDVPPGTYTPVPAGPGGTPILPNILLPGTGQGGPIASIPGGSNSLFGGDGGGIVGMFGGMMPDLAMHPIRALLPPGSLRVGGPAPASSVASGLSSGPAVAPPAPSQPGAPVTFNINNEGVMGHKEIKSTMQTAVYSGTRWSPNSGLRPV